MKRVILGMVLTLAPCCVYAIDLDAPPIPKKITTRSEIARGAEAIKSCLMDRKKDPLDCAETIINNEKINNADSDAFMLGAYYVGCSLTQRSVHGNAAYFARKYCGGWSAIQKEMALTDAEICKLTNMRWCEEGGS